MDLNIRSTISKHMVLEKVKGISTIQEVDKNSLNN